MNHSLVSFSFLFTYNINAGLLVGIRIVTFDLISGKKVLDLMFSALLNSLVQAFYVSRFYKIDIYCSCTENVCNLDRTSNLEH